MSNLLISVGLNLVKVRRDKKMSREELSAQVGISESELEAIENGKQDIELHLLCMIADILEVPVAQIMFCNYLRDNTLKHIYMELDKCDDEQLLDVQFLITCIRSRKKNK